MVFLKKGFIAIFFSKSNFNFIKISSKCYNEIKFKRQCFINTNLFIFLYRHERPSDPDDPLNDQNIRDRYYGSKDPVADKIMKRAETLPSLNPPEDPLITTLYIGGLGDESEANAITEQDLRNHFYQYGEIRQVTVVQKQGCAFIQVSSIH